ncbi:hypothetical protein [Nocardioides sambongensis]|uniref:hypothetical protein n=1 Tax=Nocardioides sambongensis TaxID=2589074 RepID=UPI00112CBA78|nr:hypothetical protein [Nocardioides sambongensis]
MKTRRLAGPAVAAALAGVLAAGLVLPAALAAPAHAPQPGPSGIGDFYFPSTATVASTWCTTTSRTATPSRPGRARRG